MSILRKAWLPGALAVMLGLLSSCGKENTAEFRLTYSVFFPATHVHTLLANEWAEEINRRTNGRVVVEVYPGSVLSGASENYDCVLNGVSDLGMSCFSYTKGFFPLIEGLDLPLGYPDGRVATRVANEFIARFKPEEIADTELMYVHAHGPGVLATRDPVDSLKSLKGMSIRGTGITAQMVTALGGNAVGLGQPDTYEALRKGVVSGTFCPMETLKGWSQGEVIQYVTDIPSVGYTTAMFVVMNKKKWQSLPPDIQQVIREVNAEWIDKHGEKWNEADAEGLEFVKSLNRQIGVLPAEEDAKAAKAVEPMLDRWVADVEKRGLPGKEALAFLRERLSYYAAHGIDK